MRGLLKAVSLWLFGFVALGLSACGSDSTSLFVVSVQVTPATASVAPGESTQLQAKAVYSDGTETDVTAQAQWTTSNPSAVAVNKGTVIGVQQTAAPVTISATFDGVLGTATINVVHVVRIDVTPASASVAKGATLQLQAVATYSDDTTRNVTTQATWSSTNPGVATVSDAGTGKGLVTGVQQSATAVSIRANFDQVQGAASITVGPAEPVSVEVSPAESTVAKGTATQLQAIATYTDDSTQNVTTMATWTSNAPQFAAVGNGAGGKGLVTGVEQRAAPVTISAALEGLTGSASVTVGPPLVVRIEVAPTTLSLPNGTSGQLAATAVYTDNSTQDITDEAEWSSAAPAVVAVGDSDEDKGEVTALALTSTPITITATFGTFSDSADVTVTEALLDEIQISPANVEVPSGLTEQFNATAIFTDGSTQDVTDTAEWGSSDPTVATIGDEADDKGLLTAVSADPDPITVSAMVGDVTGTTQVTVTSGVLQQIDVQPASVSLPRFGFQTQFTATGTFSDGETVDLTSQAIWESSADEDIATISNSEGQRGVATSGDTAGTSQITATVGDVTSAPATLTVTEATLQSVELHANDDDEPETELFLSLGRTVNLRAVGVFSTGSGGLFGGGTTSRRDITQSVTWASENDEVATVSNASSSKGRLVTQSPSATAVEISATITIGGVTRRGSLDLTVSNAALVSLDVSASTQKLAGGFRTPLTAMGTFGDGSTADVTTEVTWVTGNSNVATVSNVAGQEGVVKGGAKGTVTITAKRPGSAVEDSVQLTVTDAVLQQISVLPGNTSIRQGETLGYAANGRFSDNSTLDLSRFNGVAWSSSDANVAVVDAATGVATGRAQGGPVQITATRGSISGSAQLRVSGYALADVVIVPQSPEGCAGDTAPLERVPSGFARRFFACARYFNGTVVNVTANAQWTSQATNVVTMGNTGAIKGRAAAVGDEGEQGVIRASYSDDGITAAGTYTISVIDGDIESIVIQADSELGGELGEGTVVNFTALADFSDGSDGVNITESATWTSSDVAVATISNTDGSRGRATVVAVDEDDPMPPTEADITASAGGVTSNALTIQRDNGP